MRLLVRHTGTGGRHTVRVVAPDLYDDCLAYGQDVDVEAAKAKAAAELRVLRESVDRTLALLTPQPAPATNPGGHLASTSE